MSYFLGVASLFFLPLRGTRRRDNKTPFSTPERHYEYPRHFYMEVTTRIGAWPPCFALWPYVDGEKTRSVRYSTDLEFGW